MIAHLLFEQSGTFKNEFKKLGIAAYDYDILNDFGQTDCQIDLFNEIEKCYMGGGNIFDNIKTKDIILAFFPCVRFEVQMILNYTGNAVSMKNWSEEKKLEYNIKKINELAYMNSIISKLTIICLRKNLKLIIENPYSTQHFLNRYWTIKSKIIDYDRSKNGDYYVKPTQYWFINCEPKYNYVNDKLETVEIRTISKTKNKVERSMIHSQYARRFIKRYIIDYDSKTETNKNDTTTIFDYL